MKSLDSYEDMRDVYVDTLCELARCDRRLVVLEADSMGATGTRQFLREFPDRFINTGAAEANMIGIAAGLSSRGFIPFAATFGSFALRRAYDQLFISANYARQNVKLVGLDPGITAQYNGGTHMPFCDTALARVIPRLVVVEPADTVTLHALTKALFYHRGSAYMRLQRRGAVCIHSLSERVELGRGIVIQDGTDVTLTAVGTVMLCEALKAAAMLREEGVSAAVIDMHTIKPLDTDLLSEYARKTELMVFCENAQTAGGLGSAAAEYLCEQEPVRILKIGIQDEFGEVGTLEYLQTRYGLTAEAMTGRILEILRKSS
jgi:transketolase